MLSTLRNAWNVKDLRKRLIYTFIIILIYRIGNQIVIPGVIPERIAQLSQSGGTLFNFYDLMSGGAFSQMSIFAMGVYPYINASIIMNLLTIAIPKLEQLSKEGEEGRKKINNFTRYGGIVLAAIQAFGTYAIASNQNALTSSSKLTLFVIILTLTTASTLLVWMGEQITNRGIGNGVSLIIFVNIVSRFPNTLMQIGAQKSAGKVNLLDLALFAIVGVALLLMVIVVSMSERRIPVQYAGKTVGNKTFKGQTTHIPINLNSSGVIAIIFAMSVMQFPEVIAKFMNPTSAYVRFVTASPWSPFKSDNLIYIIIYFILILFFTWFYTGVTFKPDEMAENMHKSAGFIPGIRPGQPTARYIENILTKSSVLGGIFAAIVAIVPMLAQNYSSFKGIHFGGTTLLIMVGVCIEFIRQIESQLVMRNYQGFLK